MIIHNPLFHSLMTFVFIVPTVSVRMEERMTWVDTVYTDITVPE